MLYKVNHTFILCLSDVKVSHDELQIFWQMMLNIYVFFSR